jgi:hypothetical protein
MAMKILIVLVIAAILCGGCSQDLYDFVNRNTKMPVVSEPQVECLKVECEIDVCWDADDAADEYLLYRDDDPFGPFDDVLYKGKELHFKDMRLEGNGGKLYYYKLAKRRAEWIFDKSDYVLGVAHTKRRDCYEPNGTPETAAEFYNVTDANIYYYKYDSDHALEDVDWYWVEMEPMRKLRFSIFFNDDPNLQPDDLYYMEMGGFHRTDLDGDDEIYIYNYENEVCIKYFCIGINKIYFDGVGGRMGSYQIRLLCTEPVSME